MKNWGYSVSDRRNKTNGGGRLARHVAQKQQSKLVQNAFNTLPILLAGSMALSLNMTGPLSPNEHKRADKPKDSSSELRTAIRTAMTQQAVDSAAGLTPANSSVASTAPSKYRVTAGDTVSGIAARYGLATASVLALNGLSWKSIIFPGQVLTLGSGSSVPAPVAAAPTTSSRYTIVRGDTIGQIAARFGVTTQSILTANGLGWSSIIYPGQTVAIPGKTVAAAPAPVAIVPVVEVTPISPPASPSPPTPASQPAPTSPPAPTSQPAQNYLIKSGDTISHIAARFGISVSSLLSANGLKMSSIIYSGRTLIIPGLGSVAAGSGDAVAIMTAEMEANARTIVSVGRSLNVPEYGLVIALAAAMQESTLRNLNYGDRDSLGLFQQRPSTGWGTPAQVTDTVYASKLFFGGASNPNKENTRGLLDVSGWQSMTVTQAAQAVQRSAYPDAYAKWEASARAWLRQLS